MEDRRTATCGFAAGADDVRRVGRIRQHDREEPQRLDQLGALSPA